MTRKALARRIAELLFNEPAALLHEPQTCCTRFVGGAGPPDPEMEHWSGGVMERFLVVETLDIDWLTVEPKSSAANRSRLTKRVHYTDSKHLANVTFEDWAGPFR
jgi:hypothetical protein